MRMPASAGPATWVSPIDTPRSALASCSRPALTVIGVSPVEAGLKNAVPVPASACRTISSQTCAVGEGSSAADEQENHQRGGVRGNHEAEVARGPRQVEHRPGERERRDRIAKQRHQLSREEQAELSLLERAERDAP